MLHSGQPYGNFITHINNRLFNNNLIILKLSTIYSTVEVPIETD